MRRTFIAVGSILTAIIGSLEASINDDSAKIKDGAEYEVGKMQMPNSQDNEVVVIRPSSIKVDQGIVTVKATASKTVNRFAETKRAKNGQVGNVQGATAAVTVKIQQGDKPGKYVRVERPTIEGIQAAAPFKDYIDDMAVKLIAVMEAKS